jgi:hypothetical protein
MIMQTDSEQRKGEQGVADVPPDDEIRDKLRNLSHHTGIPTLARAMPDAGERTVYNQLGAQPKPMRARTRTAFLDLLEAVGALEDGADLRAAGRRVRELAKLAEEASNALDDLTGGAGDPTKGA